MEIKDFKNLPKAGCHLGEDGYWHIRCYVYKLVNLDNGKFYIGVTKNPRARAEFHFRDLKKHNHHNPYVNADSECRFGFEIIETVDDWSVAKKRETYYMKTLRSFDERIGYNACDPKVQGFRRDAGLQYYDFSHNKRQKGRRNDGTSNND